MTPLELENLQHALGVDQYGRGAMYRNSFVTSPGCDDHAACMRLVDAGLMTVTPGGPIFGGMDCFRVTDAGKLAVMMQSPSPARRTRAQRRYKLFLKFDGATSFGEFLKSPYRQVRS